ncbi:recombinase family protein [Oceanicola sp. S124]|uniref:recombinase family protein n=1 Tax=Oceanicola sp. S124 TaxID=1042378 RepID=UPI0009FCF784|nr:recombinase family protein [Oceanicola sp. S124]
MTTAEAQTGQSGIATKGPETRKRRAIGYLRVSTSNQAASELGFEAQQIEIQAWADREGVEIIRFVREQASARGERNFAKRRKLREILRIAQGLRVPIVVATPSRVTRHVRDYAKITAILPGDQIIIARSNRTLDESYPELVRAAHEGDAIAQRSREGTQKKKRAGQTFGSPDPQALQEAGRAARIAKRDERVEWVRKVLEDIGVEATAQEVADELNRKGYATAQGNDWTKVRIRRLLRRAREQLNAQLDQSCDEQGTPEEIYKDNALFGLF